VGVRARGNFVCKSFRRSVVVNRCIRVQSGRCGVRVRRESVVGILVPWGHGGACLLGWCEELIVCACARRVDGATIELRVRYGAGRLACGGRLGRG